MAMKNKLLLLFFLSAIFISIVFAIVVIANEKPLPHTSFELGKDWNLISVTRPMIGKSFADMTADSADSEPKVCVAVANENKGIKAGYIFENNVYEYVKVKGNYDEATGTIEAFGEEHVGKGLWVKVEGYESCTISCGVDGCEGGSGETIEDDFEKGFGKWTNTDGDDFDWSLESDTTSSSGTGPSDDHTSGSGSYVYTEASGTGFPSKTAMLIGPTINFDTQTNEKIEFWYHMYGSSMGKLYLEYLEEGSTGSWQSLWTKSGDQGNKWKTAVVDLSSLSGTGHLRFRGVTGSSYTSDMAVDDITMEDVDIQDVALADGTTSGGSDEYDYSDEYDWI
jgi:hypothetical protein